MRLNLRVQIMLPCMLAGLLTWLLLTCPTRAQDVQPEDPAAYEAPAEPPPPALPPPSDGDYGPPEAAVSPDDWEEESYVDKEDGIYPDVYGAWGWMNSSYLIAIGIFNVYVHDEGSSFGFHGRILSLGALSYERRMFEADGSSTVDREHDFMFGLSDLSLRMYFGDSVFMAYTLSLGALSYEGLVPTADLSVGLGFEWHGWGIEAGIRSSRVPRRAVAADEELKEVAYFPMVYTALELDVGY